MAHPPGPGQARQPAAARAPRHQGRRHPHLAKPNARPDKVQRWADHKDSRTTQRYKARKALLDDSPGYGLAADVVSALDQGTA
ncbi:hypothetical protein [Streptomyces sp. Isolate_45]|uniref:hypothetical protein n=1 Tax=Streptomyces sp. Isolate_45 TaxID=2950111 RepID=UPI0024819870|nr:hypothetical protein [Streptomyces sp. Isolate_45]MDA5284732.1 hypothetical protein [Streptomyces sp. Isolate_45]